MPQLEIPKDFFKEETRCGYVISEKMKRIWAIQLDLLSELQRVCQKYGLTYYADSGTLLGAVRHKGYIPWDDDIDIVMMRDDYQKLLAVADQEFLSPYYLQNALKDGVLIGYSRLRNEDTTAILRREWNKNIIGGIFVDIFPIDNMPDNILLRSLWAWRIKHFYQMMYYGCVPQRTGDTIYKRALCTLLKKYFDVRGFENAYRHYESICEKYNSVETKMVSYIAYSRGKKKHFWYRNSFASSHNVPFEFIEVNIQDGYDERLRIEYGNYMEIKRTPTVHGQAIMEPDIPYNEYMKMHSDEEIELSLTLLQSN